MEFLNDPNEQHIMIDIETLDTIPSAIILSIGAVAFKPEHERDFYLEIFADSQYIRTSSLSTLTWWKSQKNFPKNPSVGLTRALTSLSSWIRDVSRTRTPIIWCKGTDFDVTILADAYRQYKLPIPWKYSKVRDCRTIFKTFAVPITGASHNALADAKDQAHDLLVALSSIRRV